MSNAPIRNRLINIYGNRCMLTGMTLIRGTYHHIQKSADNGPSTVDNGALLELKVHEWLNKVEILDKDTYELINQCLLLYKACKDLNKTNLVNQYESEVASEVKRLVYKKH